MIVFYILGFILLINILFVFGCYCSWSQDYLNNAMRSSECLTKKLYKGLVSVKKHYNTLNDKQTFTDKLHSEINFVSFPQFLWGCYFILPSFFMMLTRGILKLYVKLFLIYLKELFDGTRHKKNELKF